MEYQICSWCWGYSCEQNRKPCPHAVDFLVAWGQTGNKYVNGHGHMIGKGEETERGVSGKEEGRHALIKCRVV